MKTRKALLSSSAARPSSFRLILLNNHSTHCFRSTYEGIQYVANAELYSKKFSGIHCNSVGLLPGLLPSWPAPPGLLFLKRQLKSLRNYPWQHPMLNPVLTLQTESLSLGCSTGCGERQEGEISPGSCAAATLSNLRHLHVDKTPSPSENSQIRATRFRGTRRPSLDLTVNVRATGLAGSDGVERAQLGQAAVL